MTDIVNLLKGLILTQPTILIEVNEECNNESNTNVVRAFSKAKE